MLHAVLQGLGGLLALWAAPAEDAPETAAPDIPTLAIRTAPAHCSTHRLTALGSFDTLPDIPVRSATKAAPAGDAAQRDLGRCTPGPVPDALRAPPYALDGFYQKYCDANGIHVLGSDAVPDAAVVEMYRIVLGMTRDPEALQGMVALQTRAAVMAKGEVTTDIPEHADLYAAFPGTDWDIFRGLGATPERPVVTGAEENLLQLEGDVYAGQNIFVHEFAHAVHIMGYHVPNAGTFDAELRALYADARTNAVWNNTYAISNENEYFAESVQSWFNVNVEAIPTDGVYNFINTRDELEVYDPGIHALISRYMADEFRGTESTRFE